MVQVSTNEFRSGLKIEIDSQPYVIVNNEFVKPGKGQSFNRVKIKNLLNGRTIERTFKSGEKVDVADVNETQMRMLYKDQDNAVFMDDDSFDQVEIPLSNIGNSEQWLIEEMLYDIIFYKAEPISVEPPTFLELKITDTAPGLRGDTTGRVTKPATLETGAVVQVPIFINEGEVIKVDTRTCDYVSRV